MNRTGKWIVALGLAIAAGIAIPARTAAASSPPDKLSFTVYLNDRARIAPNTLARAEDVASRIFRNVGVGSRWIDSGQAVASAERELPHPSYIWVTILPATLANRITPMEDVAGLAIGEGPNRRLAYVFYNRVLEMQASAGDYALGPGGAGDFLGTVMAHEIGHILLDLTVHPETGIMRGNWGLADLHGILLGHLQFTKEQGKEIQVDVARRARLEPALSTAGRN